MIHDFSLLHTHTQEAHVAS